MNKYAVAILSYFDHFNFVCKVDAETEFEAVKKAFVIYMTEHAIDKTLYTENELKDELDEMLTNINEHSTLDEMKLFLEDDYSIGVTSLEKIGALQDYIKQSVILYLYSYPEDELSESYPDSKYKEFTINEIIQEVKSDSPFGKQFVQDIIEASKESFQSPKT